MKGCKGRGHSEFTTIGVAGGDTILLGGASAAFHRRPFIHVSSHRMQPLSFLPPVLCELRNALPSLRGRSLHLDELLHRLVLG